MPRKQPDPIDRVIGVNMRKLRRKAGLTQARVASELCLEHHHIHYYETGKSSIAAKRVARLAAVFRCQVSDFFKVG
jgi:transcriptional regulator with XRE-family HTH domain